ncbi:MAG: 23S rRNA (uracil(1939)-C(5))-methyltransferase RlmD [Alphaproteobacteria bacterium]
MAGADPVELTIESLGAAGDGVASHGGARVFVPYTVPGDRVRVVLGPGRAGDRQARVVARLADGPDRAVPPCPHFGDCGGCALQHLALEAYRTWKQGVVVEALARRGLADVPVAPLVDAALPRRRASFALARAPHRGIAGFHRRYASKVVDVVSCVIVEPALRDLLPRLRELVAALPSWRGPGQAVVTRTDTGIDLVLAADLRLDATERERLTRFAAAVDLARLSHQRGADVAAEPVIERRAPTLDIDGVKVVLPPGGFLQPTAAGEAAIGARIVAALGDASRVADLYAGLGTWTFRLVARARVHAVEGDGALVAALKTAATRAGLMGRVEAEARDLARRPLMAEELRRFDAVVFDPPRAGAAETAAELARSRVPVVVAVSCNPATFARDARTLVDGGYRLVEVTPIDQFRYAAHVELVGVFHR